MKLTLNILQKHCWLHRSKASFLVYHVISCIRENALELLNVLAYSEVIDRSRGGAESVTAIMQSV